MELVLRSWYGAGMEELVWSYDDGVVMELEPGVMMLEIVFCAP